MSQNFSSRLSAALIGTVIVVIQSPVACPQTASEQAIATQAKEVTVVINGQNPGSGVIIAKQGNTYYVLTAKHVVATQDEYEIFTADGTKHALDYRQVKKLPRVDLAVVQFTSNQSYRVAQLGDSEAAKEGTTIYIAGWPRPGRAITERIYQMTPGSISGRALKPLEGGYALVYTNITRSGMSGGPILDAQGRVIGIHGRAEGEPVYNPDTGSTVDVKSGFNLGIPIKTFLDLTSATDIPATSTFAFALTALGDRSLQVNQFPEAIAYYQRAITQDANYLPAVFNLGQLKYEQGDLAGAIRLWQTAMGIDSKAVTPQLALAAALYTKGDRDRGLAMVFALLKTNENRVLESLTKNLLSQRLLADLKGLLAYSQKASTVGSQNFPVEFNQGLVKYEQGDVEGAIRQLQTAVEIDKKEAPPQLALATALYAKGDRERGVKIASAILSSAGLYTDSKVPDLQRIQEHLWGDRLLTSLQQLLAYFSPTKTFKAHLHNVGYLAFSPDGQTLVSSAWDDEVEGRSRSTIKLWNPRTGELRSTYTITAAANEFAISPDGQTIAAADADGVITLWNLRVGKLLGTIKDDRHTLYCITFSPDGQLLAGGTIFDIAIWNVRTSKLLGSIKINEPNPEFTRSVVFSPDGQIVAGGYQDGKIRLWNVRTGQLKSTLTGHSNAVLHIAFSPDGQTLASSAERDETTKLWNISTGQMKNTLASSGAIAFSPDGQTLASGDTLWNLATGEKKSVLRSYDFIFSPDGQIMASSGDDGTIEIWRVKP